MDKLDAQFLDELASIKFASKMLVKQEEDRIEQLRQEEQMTNHNKNITFYIVFLIAICFVITGCSLIDYLEDDDPENLILVDNSTNSIIYTHKNEKSSFYRRLLFSDYQWSNDSKWVIFTHDNIEDVLPVDIYLFDVESKNLSTISSDITTQNAYL